MSSSYSNCPITLNYNLIINKKTISLTSCLCDSFLSHLLFNPHFFTVRNEVVVTCLTDDEDDNDNHKALCNGLKQTCYSVSET